MILAASSCGGLIFAGQGVAAGGSEDVKVVDTVKAVFVAAAADDLGEISCGDDEGFLCV